MLTRGYDMTPLGDGMGQFVGHPSMLDVANAYFCAYDFVAYGFHRLQELGSAPEADGREDGNGAAARG